jgi:hypothetical protein
MAKRGLKLDHSTTARWVLLYAPVLNERIRLEMRWPNRSWRVDETLPVRATLRSESFSAADCALVCQYPIDGFVQQRATRWKLTLASRLIIRIYP